MGLKIGLALGGGGSKGAFTVGVLRTLIARFDDATFPVIAGTSTGSLIGTGIAQGQFADVVEIYRGTLTDEIVNPHHALVAGLFGPEAVLFLAAIVGGRAIYDASGLRETVDEHLDDEAIRNSETQLWYDAVDLQSGNVRHIHVNPLSRDEMIDSLMASSSQPVLMDPVKLTFDGVTHDYVDGGVRELIPLTAVFESGVEVDRIVAISTSPLEPIHMDDAFDEIMDILVRTLGLYDSEVGRNDYFGAVQFNALLKILENAVAFGMDPSDALVGVPAVIRDRMAGKRSVPVTYITPSEHIDMDSLVFEPEPMQELMDQGQVRARDFVQEIRNPPVL